MSSKKRSKDNRKKQTNSENVSKDKDGGNGVGRSGSSKDTSFKAQSSTIAVDVPGVLATPQQAQDSVAPLPAPTGPTSQVTSKKRKYNTKSSDRKRARLSDNPKHDPRKKPEVGKPAPELLRFKLKLINGGYTKPYRYQFRNDPKWDDKKWIDALHKWRKGILDRIYIKEDVEGENNNPSNKKGPRTRWSFAEIEYLRVQIRNLVRSTGDPLTTKDWKKLAEIHNERFKGKEIRIGEKLANGGVATTNQIIETRSWNAINGFYNKFPEMKAMVEEEIKAWRSDSSEEDEKSDDKSGREYEYDDEETDEEVYDIEESSDDEDEGRPPARQPVGSVLVEATA
ncbi:hypothetical protein DL95DRAFT_454717 [Leptodontidium sp. 2 PMI_412]|nr:hypothetical protein DL95DRAFT_454717 [Leptodontidium sp. 2 PMI_412]